LFEQYDETNVLNFSGGFIMTTQAQVQSTTFESTGTQRSMLRTVILADSVFCDVTGFALLLFNKRIGGWVGLPPLTVAITGGLLMLWALDLFIFGRRDPMPRWLPYVVIGENAAWVILTIAALVAGFLPLTLAGKWSLVHVGRNQ
jgi:hypothetical protein